MQKNIIKLAKQLKKSIGKHYKLIGKQVPADVYYEAQRESDEAVSLAKYLIQHLADRHQATVFAHAVGMSGYIYMMR